MEKCAIHQNNPESSFFVLGNLDEKLGMFNQMFVWQLEKYGDFKDKIDFYYLLQKGALLLILVCLWD